jgi:hypothetical protein
MRKYEYKFTKLKYDWWGREPKNYKEIIEEHAREGWRLNQILAPSGYYGTTYFELIFEREINS